MYVYYLGSVYSLPLLSLYLLKRGGGGMGINSGVRVITAK